MFIFSTELKLKLQNQRSIKNELIILDIQDNLNSSLSHAINEIYKLRKNV